MSKANVSGWEMLKLMSFTENRSTIGTIKTSSRRERPERGNRPYGGRSMSVARLYATRPTHNVVAQRTNDITM